VSEGWRLTPPLRSTPGLRAAGVPDRVDLTDDLIAGVLREAVRGADLELAAELSVEPRRTRGAPVAPRVTAQGPAPALLTLEVDVAEG